MTQGRTQPRASWEQTLVANVREYAIFRLTPSGDISSWNAGAERINGYSAAEAIGQHFSMFYPPEDREAGIPDMGLEKTREEGEYTTEGWRLRKDGSRFWASVLITPLLAENGTLTGFAKVVRDMTDKRLAHDAVIESERRFRLLVQGVTDYSIFMLSPEGNVANWNLGAARIKGYEASEVIGTHFRRFYTPEDAARGLPERGLETAAREGRFETEGWRMRKDGSRFWANVVIDAIREENGELIGYAKITRDVTERKAAQQQLENARAQLLQAQKMEAIGKLTGGVAHNFNNVLQVLRGNLELLERRHGDDPWSRERLDKAIDAVEHGANLASQLLAFGRRQALEPRVVNLGVMLRNMDDLLRRALGDLIEVETVVADDLWNTHVDPNHLENVVLNLAINGRDAMATGGRLTLELTNTAFHDAYGAVPEEVEPGEYVLLAITDTGTGMPREVLDRVFEPYFSTKPEGQGTGLGLSMAYGFIRQSGGHLQIYSEVGQGTTVKVYLPRSTDQVLDVAPLPELPITGGAETILVVEDDRYVQAAAVEMLSDLGYTVLKADDAQSAMAIIGSGIKIDLLFTDVVMPGQLRSSEMARLAVRALPDLKVLFTSGYAENAIIHGGRLEEGVQLLTKPYSRAQLATKVRRILGPAPEPEPMRHEKPATEQAAAARKSLSILVVDDEPATREAVSELLTEVGYEVRQAANESEALHVIEERPVHVLITDIALQGHSGVDLARRARELCPGLNVIFASGNEAPQPRETGFDCVAVRKPFSAEQLCKLIERTQTPLQDAH